MMEAENRREEDVGVMKTAEKRTGEKQTETMLMVNEKEIIPGATDKTMKSNLESLFQ